MIFFVTDSKSDWDRLRIERRRSFVTGGHLRDWTINDPADAIWMYDAEFKVLSLAARPFTERLV